MGYIYQVWLLSLEPHSTVLDFVEPTSMHPNRWGYGMYRPEPRVRFSCIRSDDHQVMSSLYDASTRSPNCSLFGSISAISLLITRRTQDIDVTKATCYFVGHSSPSGDCGTMLIIAISTIPEMDPELDVSCGIHFGRA